MPSLNSPGDKKGSSFARRISLPRRSSSSDTTTTPAAAATAAERNAPPPSPRHGIGAESPAAAKARPAMPAQNSQCPPGRGHPSPSPRTVSFADDLATRKNTKGGPPNQHPPTNTEDVSLPHVDSQQQLNQYREQLARDLERRELASRGPATDHGSKSRVSPIQEEAAAATAAAAAEHVASVASILSSPHALSSGRASVASTESGNTIRGGMTPGYVAATPSLLMIINDILDLSKVDAGMMKLKYEWFHTRALIEDVNELVSTMAIAKRLELNYVVEQNVPTWIKGDKVRIRQVLLNVIGNAIKFTSEGEVFSRCRVYTSETAMLMPNEIMLEFAIIDTGRGFTEEEAELIFKPFSQIDGSSTRQHGGSGLGLVISRQLVELHGGVMEGTAVPGKGSTFTFTARFTLPTENDHPDVPVSPGIMASKTKPKVSSSEPKQPASRRLRDEAMARTSPSTDEGTTSTASSGSSVPSTHSGRSQGTGRSSVSSINVGLVHFREAARASGQDLSQMKLEIPPSDTSSDATPTNDSNKMLGATEEFRPPMYSILIICPQTHSREATTQHIEQTLPKEVPRQITALKSMVEADKLIGGDDPVHFTHIVLNLPSPEELVATMTKIERNVVTDKTTVLVLSDTGQRQAVMKLVAESKQEALLSEERVTFINKPVKPSRFAVIFDPEKVLDSSIDRNRSTAQRMVESQKASYEEIGKRMGNKGYKVLLVEDNSVNQKTITVNAKAAAHMLSILALNGTEIIPKQTVNATMLNDLRARHVGPEVIDIAELEALGERHLGCGHDL
ncbi:hypothetical protein BN1708_014596 [Verticillium longisporum]|uniref:histidine kinase n=1 Tax=Verticillium longisporum TaxID=100787 RepID=A0A0G4LX00_VERLO|nr:hypothetical protein BN1708_014596 [Verticillium longisporum]